MKCVITYSVYSFVFGFFCSEYCCWDSIHVVSYISRLFYSCSWVIVHSRKLLKCRLLGSTDLDIQTSEVEVQKSVCLTCDRWNAFAEAGFRKLVIRGFPPQVQIVPTIQPTGMAESELVTCSVQGWEPSFLSVYPSQILWPSKAHEVHSACNKAQRVSSANILSALRHL